MGWRFRATVWEWRGPSPFYFVTVPADVSAELRDVANAVTYGWGMIPVTARVGATSFTTSLFAKEEGYVVPLKRAVRDAEGIDEGDAIALTLELRP